MVPPDRIELSASPLPMARSTPELRRQVFLGHALNLRLRTMPYRLPPCKGPLTKFISVQLVIAQII